MFFVQHQCFWFQKTKLKTHKFLVKKKVATKRVFFMSLCFAKCEKFSFFAHFLPIMVDVQKHDENKFKNTMKISISAHF